MVQSLERSLRIDEELVDLMQRKMQGQFASKIDLIKSQQQMLQAQTQLSQARQQRIADLEKLYADMGLPQTDLNLKIQPWLPPAPPSDGSGVVIADDPQVLSARAAVLSAQHKVDAARAEYMPTLAVTGQYYFLGFGTSSFGEALNSTSRSNYMIGLLLTVPILPVYNVQADVKQALANVDSAQGQYQGAMASAANRTSDATVRLAEARKTLDFAIRSAELAHNNVRLTEDSYAAHQSDRFDVDNARLLAEQADLSLASAKLNFHQAGWEMYRTAHPSAFPTQLLSAVLKDHDPAQIAVTAESE